VPTLYPDAIADRVREAEEWGEGVFQDQVRRIIWGALHFRPTAVSTFAGGPPLDPAATDFAITLLRRVWKARDITAAQVGELLAALPAAVERIDGYVNDGVMGAETPTAADLQLGASLRLLLTVGDARPLVEGRPAEQVARRFFAEYEGDVPPGAFPDGWVPAP
jgi:glutathione S-transferase